MNAFTVGHRFFYIIRDKTILNYRAFYEPCCEYEKIPEL